MNARFGALAGAISAIVVVPLVAFAAGPERQAEPSSMSVSQRVTQRSAAVRNYWTPERMRAAKPMQVRITSADVAGSVNAVTAGSPRRVEPKSAAWTSHTISDPSVVPYRSHGKVFFTSNEGYDYVCSGTVVSSPDENTVATAGHCVYEPGDQVFMHNWLFVPAYKAGNDPFGTWVAEDLFTTQGWANDHNFKFDLAFARIEPNGGTSIEDAVGARGILFNQEPFQDLDAIGYPAGYPFNGRKMIECITEVDHRDGKGALAPLGMGCDMTGGSSGGGWVIDDRYVFSVVSYSLFGQDGVLYGPYFGTVAETLYEEVTGGQAPEPDPTPTVTPTATPTETPTPEPTDPPEPEPTPTEDPSDPVTHQVFLSLRLSGSLVAAGELTVQDGFEGCTAGITVEIYRIRSGAGTFVADGLTDEDGSYSIKLKNRTGRYFAYSEASTASARDVCTEGVSKVARNRS